MKKGAISLQSGMHARKYLRNCFILLIPILGWNLFFISALPQGYATDIFWKDIPALIGDTENILRILVFVLPLLMQLSVTTKAQKVGLVLYIIGTVVYFSSWIAQIYFPEGAWSQHILGFMAPAYTTMIFFTGIGLMGNRTFVRIPHMSAIYIGIATLFVIFHSTHAFIVYYTL